MNALRPLGRRSVAEALAWFILCLGWVSRPAWSATISWDGGGDGVSWTDARNWSGDGLPGAADTAVLNVGSDPSVVLSGSLQTVAALDCREDLRIDGDGLRVSGACTFQGRRVELRGGVLEAATVALRGGAALAVGNGNLAGDAILYGGRLTFLPGSTGGGRFHLRGVGTLEGNISSGATVALEGTTTEGLARWTAPGEWQNQGMLRLTCLSNDFADRGAYLEIEGVLTNAPDGILEVVVGQGDSRALSGHCVNAGTLRVETGTSLTIQGLAGGTPRLVLLDGQVEASGYVLVNGGRLTVQGGAVTGVVRGFNSEFEVGSGVAGPLTVRAVGPSCRLLGNASPAVTVWVEGTVAWNRAALQVTGEVTNRGTIHLESSSNDFADRGSYLEIAAGARLYNAPEGHLTAAPGAGDGRNFSGTLRNEGRVEIAAGTASEFRGRLESAGGTYAGDFRVLASQLVFLAPASSPTELFAYGPDNQLLSDLPTNTVVRVAGTTSYGLARLTLPAGVGIDGTLRLTCESNDYADRGAYVVVDDGVLTNRPPGRIEVRAANGDPRAITGSVRNEGTVAIEEGITLSVHGATAVFRQTAGEVAAAGAFLQEGGRFELAGGALTGTVRVLNTTVATEAGVDTPSVLRLVGPENRLDRHAAAAATLWLEGTTTWGLSRLRVPAPTFSAGTIHLESTSNDFADRGAYLSVESGAVLTNLPGARLTTAAGAGDARVFTGNLWHRGRIEVGTNTTLDFTGRLDLDGGVVTGDLRLFGSEVATYRPAAEESTIPLYATANRLVTDVESGYTLWVQGNAAQGQARLTAGRGFTLRGVLRLESSSNDFADRGSYLDVTGGPLTIAPEGRLESLVGAGDPRGINAEVINAGTLRVGIDTTLGRAGAEHRNPGVLLVEQGTLTLAGSRLDLEPGGLLAGNGTLDARNLTFLPRGTIRPGASPGILAYRGTYLPQTSTHLQLEAAGVTPGTLLDQWNVDGAATLAGRLSLVLTNDYAPAIGDVLPVMNFTSVKGMLETITLPDLGPDRAWLPEITATQFRLRVISAADNTNRPPSLVTQPAPVTVVKGRSASFAVTVNGTPPLAYQWQREGSDLPGANGPVLSLSSVQLEQQGRYRVVVSNAAGSVTSSPALLTVLPAVGTLIPVETAATPFVPGIAGDGVEVDVYNGLGGGRAPAWADLTGLSPTGTTPSPVIDFPSPGNTIAVGTSFTNFFRTTTTPPAVLSAVPAANFILDHEFLLRVERAADLHPDTPEIDLDLGVGSDDGFRLRVGTNELGSAGDRGFSYSWFTVSFGGEGLYPVRLLFAANAVGSSGLEFSWRTALAGQEIVPQRALYRSTLLGDRLITFDDQPAGTVITTQYLAHGLRLTTVAGEPRVLDDRPDRLVPVSPPNVFGDSRETGPPPWVVDFTFVVPGTELPGATEFFSFYAIDAETGGLRVEAFDPAGTRIVEREFHGGAGSREQGVITAPQIARVRMTQLDPADAVAVDHLGFVTPGPLNLPPVLAQVPDVELDEGGTATFQASATDPDAGQMLRFSLRAGGPEGAEIDPVTGQFRWVTTESDGPGDYPVTVVVTDNGQPPLLDEQAVRIRVREVNTAPTLAAIPAQWVSADSPLLVKLSAFDADLPAQPLRFTLGADAPAGMTLDEVNGDLRWTVSPGFAPGVYATRVTVSDNGTPPLSAERPLSVTVDHAGPRVLAMSPTGELGTPVSQVEIQFDRPILASSATLEDFMLTGPAGAVALSAVQVVASDRIRIRWVEQRRSGEYQLTVGPGVLGLNRAPMNQDGDAQNGEPGDDAFQGTFRLALPDLLVTSVISPASAGPGETIALVWGVTNRGAAPALPPWFEAVRLSADDSLGQDQPVVDFRLTNALPAGGGILRTQAVTLPFAGMAGALRWVVVADANGSVAEEDENNNAFLAVAPIEVVPGLTLQLARAEVSEGDPALQGILRRNGPLAAALLVRLEATPAGQLEFPDQLILPAGQGSVTFAISARADGVVDGTVPVVLAARAEGYRDGTAPLLVRDTDVPRLRITLPATEVAEGSSLTGTVAREPVTPGPLTVRLTSDKPGQLVVPGEVLIPAGAASASFLVEPVDDLDVERPIGVPLAASAEGFSPTAATVTVLDNDRPELTLTVAPATFSEGAGSVAATATLTRRPITSRPVSLALVSSQNTAAVVPASVTIPAEAGSVTFPVGAVNDAVVDGPQTAVLTASLIDAPTGQPFLQAAQAVVTVTDDDSPALSVRIDRDAVAEGLAPAATAWISGNQDSQAPVAVTLVSSDPGELVAPPTVVLPAGNATVAVPLNSVDDGVTDGSQAVTVTATAAGFVAGADQVVVTDVNLPDLVIERLTGPASGRTDESFQATFREVNRGLAPATGAWRQMLYLSDDPFPGRDQLLGSVDFAGTVAPGLFTERTLSFRLPSVPGNYWLVAVSDPDQAVTELVEGNNVTVAATPVVVTAAYSAEVSTEVVTAPAGTVVPLAGRATRPGGPVAAFEWVNVHITRGDARRVLSALTDAEERFALEFVPLPGEAGVYRVGAAHPGVSEAPVQDTFTLLGMRFDPRTAGVTLAGAGQSEGGFEVRNLSGVPIAGLTVAVTGMPEWLDITVGGPGNLPGDGAVTVTWKVVNRRETAGAAEVWVEARAEGGLLARLPWTIQVQPRVPQLTAVPGRLESGMLRGEQTLLPFRIRNEGGAASGPVTIVLPEFPWLTVASAQPLPSLDPGSEAEVNLRLSPPADLPLGRFEGSMVLTAAGTATRVPLALLSLSQTGGSLAIEVVDEFTYYASGAPRVAGASVTVTDELSGVRAATAATDAQGRATFPELREGYYRVRVAAPGHSPAESVVLVPAGRTLEKTLFVARNTVEYRWTVTPTEIEDRTRITVEAVFETVVPAPVVVVEPSVIDFADFTAVVSQVDLKVTNHGLIAANDVRLDLPVVPGWKLEPLVTELGDLPARSSFTIPVVIRRLPEGGGQAAPAGAGRHEESLGCRAAKLLYKLVCGPFDNTYSITIGLANDGTGCPVGGGGGGWVASQAGGGGSGHWVAPRSETFDSKCGPGPCAREIGEWAFNCAFNLLDLPEWLSCGKGIYDCIKGAATGQAEESVALGCLSATVDCLKAAGQKINPFLDGALDVLSCADGMREVAECLEKAKKEKEAAGGRAGLAAWDYDLPANLLSAFAVVEQRLVLLEDHRQVYRVLLGNPAWFNARIDASLAGWLGNFQAATADSTPLGRWISVEERAALAAGVLPPGVSRADVDQWIDRWNRTVDYYAQGVFRRGQLPPGANPDFIALDEMNAAAEVSAAAVTATEAAGFNDPAAAVKAAVRDWLAIIEASGLVRLDGAFVASSPVRGRAALPAAADSSGICARVRLRLDQEAVISRDAFEARLEVENRQDLPLREVRVDLVIREPSGRIATERFGIRPPVLTGFGAVDGTGRLEAQSTGTAVWTLIPSSEAAPSGPATYLVSGSLRYVEEGLEVSIPLAPAAIDVLPNASLAVKYFHQRDVLGDDPFTGDVVEPSVPYSLAVLVRNNGQGAARNVRIASAQPRIVENEKGLLADFQILGTEVDGRGLSPSLTVNLGDLAPGASAVGRWLLRSSLQGQFIEYSATFEHLDGLGDPRLSLIESVEIHELIRLVQGGDADPRTDFLVNDLPDEAFLPDTLHLSSGGTQAVATVTEGEVNGAPSAGRLEVNLVVALPAGWAYLRIPEPSGGTFTLREVRRPDGSLVPAANFWVTDRTFIAGGRRPVYEHRLHLLDRDSAGRYTLVYAPVPPVDRQPPASAVAALPSASPARIALAWSGTDEAGGSGVAGYDVYVAEDGGEYRPWLRNTGSTGAMFLGVPGRSYAFYSVAVDGAGNREDPPPGPDASTTVSLTNRPPVLVAPATVRVREGEVVQFRLVASDPDEPGDRLTFRLGGGVPAGVEIEPATGRLTWATSEALGPSTNRIPVEVTDDGIPALSASAVWEVVVTEENSAPLLEALVDRQINEGETLEFLVVGRDADLPANQLRYRLVGAPPAGAALDPVTGRFSWIPGPDQGGQDYAFTVEVSDDAVPPGTATGRFLVRVNDVLPDFQLRLGRTAVRAGEVGRVAVELDSGQPLAEVAFEVQFLGGPFPFPELVSASEVAGASLQWLQSDRLRAVFSASAGLPFSGRLGLGELVFATASNAPSVLVRLRVEELVARRPVGTSLVRGLGSSGRLAIVADRPLLEAAGEESISILRLFAPPGTSWDLERQVRLSPGEGWELVQTVMATGLETVLTGIVPDGFYRVVSPPPAVPRLEMGRTAEGALEIRVTGRESAGWLLEQTGDLGVATEWKPVAPVPAGSGVWTLLIPAGDGTSGYRWYRLRRVAFP